MSCLDKGGSGGAREGCVACVLECQAGSGQEESGAGREGYEERPQGVNAAGLWVINRPCGTTPGHWVPWVPCPELLGADALLGGAFPVLWTAGTELLTHVEASLLRPRKEYTHPLLCTHWCQKCVWPLSAENPVSRMRRGEGDRLTRRCFCDSSDILT